MSDLLVCPNCGLSQSLQHAFCARCDHALDPIRDLRPGPMAGGDATAPSRAAVDDALGASQFEEAPAGPSWSMPGRDAPGRRSRPGASPAGPVGRSLTASYPAPEPGGALGDVRGRPPGGMYSSEPANLGADPMMSALVNSNSGYDNPDPMATGRVVAPGRRRQSSAGVHSPRQGSRPSTQPDALGPDPAYGSPNFGGPGFGAPPPPAFGGSAPPAFPAPPTFPPPPAFGAPPPPPGGFGAPPPPPGGFGAPPPPPGGFGAPPPARGGPVAPNPFGAPPPSTRTGIPAAGFAPPPPLPPTPYGYGSAPGAPGLPAIPGTQSGMPAIPGTHTGMPAIPGTQTGMPAAPAQLGGGPGAGGIPSPGFGRRPLRSKRLGPATANELSEPDLSALEERSLGGDERSETLRLVIKTLVLVVGGIVLVLGLIDGSRLVRDRGTFARILDDNINSAGMPTPGLPVELQRQIQALDAGDRVVERYAEISARDNMFRAGVRMKHRVAVLPMPYTSERTGTFVVRDHLKTLEVYRDSGWKLDEDAVKLLERIKKRSESPR